MAGDWIKMRTALGADRATMVICDLTGLDEFAVVGRLHAIWVWAGEHTVTGDVTGVTLKTVDRVTRLEGFGEAMKASGWLEVLPDGGLRFPRWKRHNSKAAKERALAAARSAKARQKKRDAKRDVDRDATVTNHATREEKEKRRIEKEKSKENPLPPLPELLEPIRSALEDWLAYKRERGESYKPQGLKAFVSRVESIVRKCGSPAVTNAMQRAMAGNWQGWEHDVGKDEAVVQPKLAEFGL
jgi:hypothetical protein